ncbi:MAG TPA: hypothetical protein VK900_03965 [Anaerolineales bacterium]|nr:hypothetical protein [Anaerolineales bacterium]
MSSEERKKILQMVEEGRISAEQAASLMRALEVDGEPERDSDDAEIEVFEPPTTSGGERVDAPEFEQVKARARRFSMIPLWIGVFITVLSAWGIYAIQQSVGTGFWFYCMILPLMLGVLLIGLGAGARTSRWIYIDVDRRNARKGDGPRHITLALPLPLGLVAWFFRTFGRNLHGMSPGRVDGIIQMLEVTRNSREPLIINVDDREDGERVQLFIG